MDQQQPESGSGQQPGQPPHQPELFTGPTPTGPTPPDAGPPGYFLAPPPAAPKPRRLSAPHTAAALAVFAVGMAGAGYSYTAAQKQDAAAPTPPSASQTHDEDIRAVWRTAPVESILPSTMPMPGGEQYVRLGVASPAACDVLPRAFRAALTSAAPATRCVTVLRATYTDTTRTVLATVGIVVIDGAAKARDQVWRQWTPDSDAKNPELMPDVLPVSGTSAALFTNAQRIVWNSEATTDGAYLAYVVAGFSDGRAGSTPDQITSGSGRALAADSPPVQASVDLTPDFVTLLSNLEKNGAAS